MDLSMQDYTAEMMLGMKADNERLKLNEEIRVRHWSGRETGRSVRQHTNKCEKAGLEAEMNPYNGKVVALRTEHVVEGRFGVTGHGRSQIDWK
jgi:hypothetical protein